MDQFQIIILAGVLAFTLAGTYVIWGPSQKFKRKRNVPGLQNLGNSCFINAVIQALAACPAFINWLKHTSLSQKVEDSKGVILILLKILLDLNSNVGLCSAADLLHVLRSQRWVISSDEQDAHEFFHVLTTTLEEEDLTNSRSVLSLLEVSKLESIPSSFKRDIPHKVFIRSSNENSIKSNHPFRGLLANQLACKQCNHKFPVKYDTFDSISLSIPSPFLGPLTLQDCIKKFVSCEQIRDVTCDVCNEKQKAIPTASNGTSKQKAVSTASNGTSKQKSTFIKQSSFGKLPECLCFHIQRTIWMSNGMTRKCYDYLMFPEIFSMDSYVYKSPTKKQTDSINIQSAKLIGGSFEKCESFQSSGSVLDSMAGTTPSLKKYQLFQKDKGLPAGDHIYLLKAVIVHLGDMLSGHFITYRRGAINTNMERKWYCTSDTSTKEVSFHDVKQVCAYMLFYEKIPPSIH